MSSLTKNSIKLCYFCKAGRDPERPATALVVGHSINGDGEKTLRHVWVCEQCLTDDMLWAKEPRVIRWVDVRAVTIPTCTNCQFELLTSMMVRDASHRVDEYGSRAVICNGSHYARRTLLSLEEKRLATRLPYVTGSKKYRYHITDLGREVFRAASGTNGGDNA